MSQPEAEAMPCLVLRPNKYGSSVPQEWPDLAKQFEGVRDTLHDVPQGHEIKRAFRQVNILKIP